MYGSYTTEAVGVPRRNNFWTAFGFWVRWRRTHFFGATGLLVLGVKLMEIKSSFPGRWYMEMETYGTSRELQA